MSELIEIKNDRDGIIEINPKRLTYLLKLLDLLPIPKLLEKLNEGRKRHLTKEDVSGETLKLSVLKRIDKILKQGLSYYTDSIDLPSTESKGSIFFRKDEFNANIEFADCLQVYKIERQIVKLSAMAKLSEYPKLTRKPQLKASLDDSPKNIAQGVRDTLYPQEPSPNQRKFLEQLINKLAEYDILVFEYIETHNQKNRTTIDGFFISPNAIAIKRQQQSFAREIFTLAHELGHYILGSEELDKPVLSKPEGHSKEVEYWCNAFAFAFLVPEESRARPCQKSKLGERYTQLQKQQGKGNEIKKQLAKEQGKKLVGSVPKPIHSKLEKEIYRYAYLDGVIGEYTVLKKFRTKDIDRFVYG